MAAWPALSFFDFNLLRVFAMSTAANPPVLAPIPFLASLSAVSVASKDRTVLAQAVVTEKDKAAGTAKPVDAQTSVLVPVAPSGSSKAVQESCDKDEKKARGDKPGEEDDNCAAVVVPADGSSTWILAALPLLAMGGGGDSAPHNYITIDSNHVRDGGLLTSTSGDIHFDFDHITDRLLTIYKHDSEPTPGKILCINIGDQFVEFDGGVDRVLFEGDYLSSLGFDMDGEHFNFCVESGGMGNDVVVGDIDTILALEGGAGDDILFATPDGDRLIGGKGQDLMFAGWGEDTFEINSADLDGSLDIVVNFDADMDVIDLSDLNGNYVDGSISVDGQFMTISYNEVDILTVHFAAQLGAGVDFALLLDNGVIIA